VDMGGDGQTGGRVARDVYAFSLNYYTNDYNPINSTLSAQGFPFGKSTDVANGLATLTDGVVTGYDLFNGNIKAMFVSIPKLGSHKLYGYSYDQLNRIKAMNGYDCISEFSLEDNSMSLSLAAAESYKERISYDPNGNILTYFRNGQTGN